MEFGIFNNELLCLQDNQEDKSKMISVINFKKYLGENIFNEFLNRALSLGCYVKTEHWRREVIYIDKTKSDEIIDGLNSMLIMEKLIE